MEFNILLTRITSASASQLFSSFLADKFISFIGNNFFFYQNTDAVRMLKNI